MINSWITDGTSTDTFLLRSASLPIPSREEIQASSPVDNSVSQSMLGASSGLVQGGTATETASGQLTDAQMMEDPSEAFEREIQGKR